MEDRNIIAVFPAELREEATMNHIVKPDHDGVEQPQALLYRLGIVWLCLGSGSAA